MRTAVRLRKATIALAWLLVAAALPIYAVKVARKTDYTDFAVYYRAGERAAQGDWAHVYDFSVDGASPFRYPPPSLLLFRPLAALPPDTARLGWFFANFAFFAAGFWLLFRVVRLFRADAPLITAIAALFILRFCLDTFTIGQISALMFFGFCASLCGFVRGRAALASGGLFAPTFFKIGPGVNYLPMMFTRMRGRVIVTALAMLAALLAAQALAFGHFAELWSGWYQVVIHDDVYYDASHYGNQSVKGALLRLGLGAWHAPIALAVVLGLLAFWALRRPYRFHGRAAYFSLGLFAYIWCMPETFKYSLTPLAIPVAVILAGRVGWLERGALTIGALSLSLAGLDIVGERLFFGMQRASIPLLATVPLFMATLRQAWQGSRSRFVRAALGPWHMDPAREGTLPYSLLVPIPLDSGVRLDPDFAARTLQQARQILGDGEVLLVPYGNRASALHPVMVALRGTGRELPAAIGRGAALREGFLASKGRLLFALQIEQPADPGFYLSALEKIREGFALVRANRRLAESRFRIPVRHLSMVYGRHRMGLGFNRIVRVLLPVPSTDTQSGTWAMSRELALGAFALQSAPDFLADLELSLSAAGLGHRETELPVSTELAEEKSSRRVWAETLRIALGVPMLALRWRRGYYRPAPVTGAITSDDWGISPGVNAGILELARRGIVKRVSIMSEAKYARENLSELQKIPGIELGLHFNLTYGRHALAASPGRMLLSWLRDRGRLLPVVRASLTRQLAELEAMGVRVAYVDGHHHIHLLPGLIESMTDLLRARSISYLRVPHDRALWLTSKAPLNLLAVLAAPAVRRNGFRSLPCFYPQLGDFADQGRMRAKLARHARAEVIVHPAIEDDAHNYEYPDSYGQARVTEFHSLRMLSTHTRGGDIQ